MSYVVPDMDPKQPSQVTAQLNAAQGAVYEALGSVMPGNSGTGAQMVKAGVRLQEEAEAELNAAKAKAARQATFDSATGKIKSAVGYATGDQELQTRGNVEAEGAQWKHKQATSDSAISVPVPSVEGVKGKVESAVGIVTGDQDKQMEGNARAEKAAWTEGV